MLKLLNDSPLVPIPMVTEPVPGRFQLTLIVKGTFQLSPDSAAIPLDDQPPIDGDKPWDEDSGSLRCPTDLAPYKPLTDFILAGHFHAPGGSPVANSYVSACLGNFRQAINVHGPRYWNPLSGSLSTPSPISSLPLRYEFALGGPNDKANPIGCGRQASVGADGTETWPAPQLEWQAAPFKNPRDSSGPASCNPVKMDWEPRLSKAGTYDEAWQKERWPKLPRDFDWAYFNSAPPEMQLKDPPVGNEALHLENLHPSIPSYSTYLPGMRIRCFLTYPTEHQEGSPTFQLVETPMRIDTVVTDMDQEQLTLVWRGVIEVRSDQVDEYTHWFVIDELLSETPKSYALCEQRFQNCLKEQQDEEAILTDEELQAQNEQLKDVFGNDSPTIPSDLNSRPKQEQISCLLAVGEQIRVNSKTQSDTRLSAAGIDPKAAAAQQNQIKTQRLRASGAHKQSWADLKKMEQKGLPTHKAKSELHASGLGPPVEFENDEPITQENFPGRVESGESFAGRDLTELDLSGMDLRNVDFRDAYLAGVSLQNADLTGAVLDGCCAGKADFGGATLDHASMKTSDFAESSFQNASLNHADLSKANFEGCDLSGASLLRAQAFQTLFLKCNFSRAQLAASLCQEADFSESNLDQLNAREADLMKAVFQTVKGDRADFSGARINKARFAQETCLTLARFHQVEAAEAIFLNSTFPKADLSFSNFQGAFFNGSSLCSATLNATDFSQGRFHQADLTGADLSDSNLFEADFQEAICVETSFRNSNAYSANLMDSNLTDADLAHMNQRGTLLEQKPQHQFRGKTSNAAPAGKP